MRTQFARAILAGGTMLGVGLFGPTLQPGTDMVGTQRGVAQDGVGGHAGIGTGNIGTDSRSISGSTGSATGSANGMLRSWKGKPSPNPLDSEAPVDGASGDLGAVPDNPDDWPGAGADANGGSMTGMSGH